MPACQVASHICKPRCSQFWCMLATKCALGLSQKGCALAGSVPAFAGFCLACVFWLSCAIAAVAAAGFPTQRVNVRQLQQERQQPSKAHCKVAR